MQSNNSLTDLSGRQLLHHFSDLVGRDRHCTAELLAAIAEIDERRLWAEHACPSMFALCVERFHMSESMTAKRIWAARTARRFPVILDMVRRGELHLSGIQRLGKHLSDENHRALLERARHKSSREIERLVAEVAPRPDLPSRIRALPRRPAVAVEEAHAPTVSDRSSEGSPLLRPAGQRASERPQKQVVALAPRRYKIEITVDQGTHDKLRTIEDLLAHRGPGPDPATIVSRAIDLLLEETLKKKAALTGGPRSGSPGSGRRTRAIPAAIRRQVWRRDGGRCTFVDHQGRRCRATRGVEYHHEKPWGKGGEHEVDNIALRCRAHNQYQADLDFGTGFMEHKRRGKSAHAPGHVMCPAHG